MKTKEELELLTFLELMEEVDSVMMYDQEGLAWPDGKPEKKKPKKEYEKLIELAGLEAVFWLPDNGRD